MATLVQNPTENLTENQVETPLEQKSGRMPNSSHSTEMDTATKLSMEN